MMANSAPVTLKVVFDTNVVVSATLFKSSSLSPLRAAWQDGRVSVVVCTETNTELLRVLAYPKFKLSDVGIAHVLALYLPYALSHKMKLSAKQKSLLPICRDARDQLFLELAHSAQVDYLVSGDDDLLSLANDADMQQLSFKIISPAAFMQSLGKN
jgi:uncharacterized protein